MLKYISLVVTGQRSN